MTTSMTTLRTALGGLLALALLPAFWPSDAMAQDCTDEATDLIAGRTMIVGDVNVCNDETTLTVTYEATTPWCLLATNLHVATSENDIPQTNKGNPIPGQFAFGDEHDCAPGGTATFAIPLDDIGEDGVEPGDTVVIAAHAEVRNTENFEEEGAWGDGARFVERGPWATYFTYAVQEALLCGDSDSRCVFVTSSVHEGDFGGLAQGDAICNARASEAGLPGTYKAWLSTPGAGNSAAERFTQSVVPYKLVDGALVANDFADLTSCVLVPPLFCLQHGINVTEDADMVGQALVWTGTQEHGGASAFTCGAWDDVASAGLSGLSDTPRDLWTIGGGAIQCLATAHLYCFQQ
jgi:hypothetical protein